MSSQGQVLYTRQQIEQRIGELAAKINDDYAGRQLVVVCVLKGAVIFFSELVRQLNLEMLWDFLEVSSYRSGTESSGKVILVKDLELDIKGKDVLIVEDIVDTGLTMDYTKKLLALRQPLSIRIAALLDKPVRRKVDLPVDYAGFTVPDKFIVGYGLDHNQQFRSLPNLMELKS
ncbi:hypoxanthine phosphoribosyltransferase [candidate division WOR-1 bacterium RIFOXYB2_FULL_48_7]|uniref:Hypoxanthine phosphoribosyltransferase n=1 Tax=candidate division WOR-1 bacterium RIFOXYB2_FULL_48_7 TaxID=1802583 RepID=A0A1F4TI72_UNCSA|nr:MAG: hypoxanthine phosphoribosyltransferase [candidate division WOR-1 bacterium RIFOXYB2_FULL_48_7]